MFVQLITLNFMFFHISFENGLANVWKGYLLIGRSWNNIGFLVRFPSQWILLGYGLVFSVLVMLCMFY